jgi:RecB family nuclease, putative, TM0106 family
MRLLEDHSVVLTPSDLVGFAECRHLTTLDLGVAHGLSKRPFRHDPTLELIRQKGIELEAELLAGYVNEGKTVIQLDRPASSLLADLRAAEEATISAMRSGADVIYQGTLFDGRWLGHPDFLLRIERPSALGAWSYEAAESKLARHAKPSALLQLCAYSEGLARLQGLEPEAMHLILGDRQIERHRTSDYAAYYRAIKCALEQRVAGNEDTSTYPEPVPHCRVCPWSPTCAKQWRDDDHLCRVANIRRTDTRRLRDAAIPTLTTLGSASPDRRPRDLGARPFDRLRNQARLQLEQYRDGEVRYELIPPDPEEPGRGLASLPAPSPGDVFFDIEADPWMVDGGIEYLLGVVVGDGDTPRYIPLWAHTRSEEKAAFEGLMDFIMERLDRDPAMHVYHYNDYEPVALKRLMGRYATRVDELDRLLRGDVFVDLYDVVRQGVRISQESYSLKKVEKLYMPTREGPVTTAGFSTVAYENYLKTGNQAELTGIEAYNRDDCISTFLLRRWLEERRIEAEQHFGGALPRPQPHGSEASEAAQTMAEETRQRVEALTRDIPADPHDRSPEQQAQWLLAQLLDWHRREDKPQWWSYFNLKRKSPEDLVASREALGDLTFDQIIAHEARSAIYRYIYDPTQEHRIVEGDKPLDPVTDKSAGTVVAVDHVAGTIDLKRGLANKAPHPRALMGEKPIGASAMRDALRRVADHVIANGIDGAGPYRAVRDLLLRHSPRVRGVATGDALRGNAEAYVAAARRLALALEETCLPVQGPPGSGKTYTGARMILDLVRTGKKVGITATSHKAITNLVDAVCEAAREEGVRVGIVQKADEGDASTSPEVVAVETNKEIDERLDDASISILAGTPWLMAREEIEGKLDVLFVDEAGQMSLANVVAMGGAADSLVLLGDPNQLPQVTQGTHPDGAEASALEHVLKGEKTIPPDRGLFLDTTWRLHPGIASFISEAFYENQLEAEGSTTSQRVHGGLRDIESGLLFIPVDHAGNGNRSPEEAAIVAELVQSLSGRSWTNRHGKVQLLTPNDILVVAPYNAQVAEIQRATGGACRVGTVDKFQGQEGAVVIYSMATSSPEDAPRQREFLYSGNRLNVAISRARCIGVLIANPSLLWLPCRTPQQMRLVNAFWRLVEVVEAGRG